MDKTIIRQEILASLRRLSLDPEGKVAKETIILTKLFQSAAWKQAASIGVTLSMSLELDTQGIIEKALNEGKSVSVPKTSPKGKMDFIKISSRTIYEESKFGVREPIKGDIIDKQQIDLLIVPGVAFRLDGYRVGFGGGYYDRYLADYSGQTCSLVFAEQLNQDWQPSPYDLPVNRLFLE